LILTIDLGTSATKVALWTEDGLVALGRSPIPTHHGPGGRAEQDPDSWWLSVGQALAEVRESSPTDAVEVICFSAARQSFVPVDGEGRPIGRALLWSDRRATAEAAEIANALGDAEAHSSLQRVPGVVLGSGSVMAKLKWLDRNEPSRMEAARWLLAPRDLVAARMTGVVASDSTLASATGLYDADGGLGDVLARCAAVPLERLARLLPPVLEPASVLGALAEQPASELGLTPGIQVVIGAGDRACEVLGSGASPEMPMVSWGTTANVSLPLRRHPGVGPGGTIFTRSADGGWLVEGGLSAAGALLDWIGRLTASTAIELVHLARSSPPGARGILVMPWLDGARAPWWRDDANACVLGLRSDHQQGDLARAALEGVAFDVVRCLDSMSTLGTPNSLALAGGGSTMELWGDLISAVAGVPAVRRRSGEAASAGAALIAMRALGRKAELDRIDPVVEELVPDRGVVEGYREIRRSSDQAAASILGTAWSRPEDTESGDQLT